MPPPRAHAAGEALRDLHPEEHGAGLEQDFNRLDAQREACEQYVASQAHLGWKLVAERYDDGGFTGANTDRPALQRLMRDVDAGRIDVLEVYKLDRLSRCCSTSAR